MDILKQQQNLFKLICKYSVIQPTSSKVESSFSLVKYFIKNMPNCNIETIRTRVGLKINEKNVDLKKILKSWLPSEERMKLNIKKWLDWSYLFLFVLCFIYNYFLVFYVLYHRNLRKFSNFVFFREKIVELLLKKITQNR